MNKVLHCHSKTHRVDERAMKRKRDEEELELVTLDQDIVAGNGVETADSNVESSSDVCPNYV